MITERVWGRYKVFAEYPLTKLKELIVEPNKKLSMQRHQNRNELWFVVEGVATLYTLENEEIKLQNKLYPDEYIIIQKNQWHQLSNETNDVLKIVEIQYGGACVEEDIERKDV